MKPLALGFHFHKETLAHVNWIYNIHSGIILSEAQIKCIDDNSFIEIKTHEEYRYKVSALLISSPTSSYLISVVAPCYLYCGALGDLRSSSDPATNLQIQVQIQVPT